MLTFKVLKCMHVINIIPTRVKDFLIYTELTTGSLYKRSYCTGYVNNLSGVPHTFPIALSLEQRAHVHFKRPSLEVFTRYVNLYNI